MQSYVLLSVFTHLTLFLSFQLSQKGSFPMDSQALTPASVSSLDTSSQQPQSNASAANLEPKNEAKQQDDEEESDSGSCSKGGKLSNLKMEEKPVKSEIKKEEYSGEGGKGVPMDTSAMPTSVMKTEERKPEVKKEVKEGEEASEVATPQATAKKKSKEVLCLITKLKLLIVLYQAHFPPLCITIPMMLFFPIQMSN